MTTGKTIALTIQTFVSWTSLVAQLVKKLPSMQETWVQSLGLEDPLEKGMATHSISAWRIPWTEETGRLQPMGLQRVGHDWVTCHLSAKWCLSFLIDCIGVSLFPVNSVFILTSRVNIGIARQILYSWATREAQGSLAGYRAQGHKELGLTECACKGKQLRLSLCTSSSPCPFLMSSHRFYFLAGHTIWLVESYSPHRKSNPCPLQWKGGFLPRDCQGSSSPTPPPILAF